MRARVKFRRDTFKLALRDKLRRSRASDDMSAALADADTKHYRFFYAAVALVKF